MQVYYHAGEWFEINGSRVYLKSGDKVMLGSCDKGWEEHLGNMKFEEKDGVLQTGKSVNTLVLAGAERKSQNRSEKLQNRKRRHYGPSNKPTTTG